MATQGIACPVILDGKHMAGFGLINMNGRVYDPYLQRFLSPDPIVQEPGNAQNFNRYSYVLNNPLMNIDPSGFSTLDYQEGIANMKINYGGWGFNHGWGYEPVNDATASYFGTKAYNKFKESMYFPWAKLYHSGFTKDSFYSFLLSGGKVSANGENVLYGNDAIKWIRDESPKWTIISTSAYFQIDESTLTAGPGGSIVRPSNFDYLYFISRLLLKSPPDAVSISGDIDIYAIGGSSATIAGVLILSDGTKYGFSDMGAGGGSIGVSAMIVLTKYYYVGGDGSILTGESFSGNRTQINFSGGEIFCGSIGIVALPGPNNVGYIFGISYGLGAGVSVTPIGFNINGGTTIIW